MRPTLKSDFIWTLLGNGVYSACQWSIVIILAKLGDPSKVGEYALGVAVTSPIILFATLQARGVLMGDLEDRYSFQDYLSFRLISMLAAIAIIGAIVVGMRVSAHVGAVIVFVAVGQAFEYLSDIYYGQMQKLEKMDRIARSLMMKGPVSLVAFAVCAYVTRDVVYAVLGLACGRALLLLAYDAKAASWGRPAASPYRLTWNPQAWRRLAKLCLPLGIVGTLVSVNTYLPRYFIEGALSRHDLGIFSALASLLSIGNLLVSALGQATFVRLAKAYQSADRRNFWMILQKLLGIGVLAGSVAVVTSVFAGKTILALLFRPEYGNYSSLLVWIMILGIINYVCSCLGYAMTAGGCYTPQVPLLLVTVATTGIACTVLIPSGGLRGAAIATLAGGLTQAAGSWFVLSAWSSRTTDAKLSLCSTEVP